MKTTNPIDAARVELLVAELRLPAVKQVWADLAAQADKEGWPAAGFLAALAEHKVAERARRRIERHLAEARLPPGKTIDTFDFEAVPVVSKAQIMALAAGDAWLDRGANLILFGPPGGGKSHRWQPRQNSRTFVHAGATSVAFGRSGLEAKSCAKPTAYASPAGPFTSSDEFAG